MQGPPRRSQPKETLLSALIRRMAAIVIMVATVIALFIFLGYVAIPEDWFTTTTGGTTADVTAFDLTASGVGVTLNAKVTEGESSGALWLYDGNSWFDSQFLLGASLGGGMPGWNPGDRGPAPNDFVRWFTQLRELEVTMVRVQGLQVESFYEALRRFNEDLTVPMYVLHGIEGPLESMYEESLANGEAGAVAYNHTAEFLDSVEAVVRAVQGDYPGYSHNVSQWVLGWAVGGDFEGVDVALTDDSWGGPLYHDGQYVGVTEEGTAFESWLAMALDHAVTVDMEYFWQRPTGVLSHPLLDPVTHVSILGSDSGSINPTHFNTSGELVAGTFAAYSAAPYEPDFLRFEYSDYISAAGVSIADPFAAYLYDLRQVHGSMAMFLLDSGVPSSMSCGYQGPDERWQGNLTEFESAAVVYDLIDATNGAGWQLMAMRELTDQWSADTWNTRAQTRPFDRRVFWPNAVSPNQGFGLLAVEPGEDGADLTLDGLTGDWDALPAADKSTQSSNGVVASLAGDSAFLHMRMEKTDAGAFWQFGVNDEELWVAFDTNPEAGSLTADVITAADITFGLTADALLHVHEGGADVYINKGIDYTTRYYEPVFAALTAEYEGASIADPVEADFPTSADGEFARWRLPMSWPLWRSDLGELVEERWFDVGALVEGRADTESPDTFDNRASFIVSQHVLEVRLPWFLLGYADPSDHEAWELEGVGWLTNVSLTHNDFEGVHAEVFLLGTGVDVAPPAFRDEPIFLATPTVLRDVCFCERRKMGWDVLLAKTSYFSIVGADETGATGSASGDGESGFAYCACGPAEDSSSDDELALVYQIFAWAVAVLVIFYLYSKVLKDALPSATDADYAKRTPVGILHNHPRLKRRLRFFFLYGCVVCFLVFTDFWLLRKLRDITGSVTGTAPCVYLAVVNTEALIILFATFVVDWPPEPRPYPSGYPPVYHSQIKRVALLITCHNSADRIEQTLQAALGTFEPHQIFICDNGRSMHPLDNTREIAIKVSDQYFKQEKKQRPETQFRPINYVWIPEGSKIVATFYTLEHYVKDVHFDYVMTIDDDVLLTEHLWVPFDHFKDLRVQALAMTIRAENNRDPDGSVPPLNYMQRLQDLEYKLAGLIKLFQTWMGTCLFCHGAVGFWRRDALHKVLERHDSMHMGDDLQEGLILHGLDDPLILNGLRGGYIIKAVGDVSVGTQVPTCWYHAFDFGKFLGQLFTGLLGLQVGSAVASWTASARKCKAADPHRMPTHRLRRMLHQRDLDPSGSRKKLITRLERAFRAEGGAHRDCSVKGCKRHPVRAQDVCDQHGGYGCGEPSLFSQRVMGWDCTEQRFLQKFVEISFKGLVVCNKQTYFVISMMLGQLYLILTDWLRVPIVLIFVVSDARWTFGAGLIIGWAFQVAVLVFFNETVLKRRNGLDPLGVKRKTIIYFPVYKMLMSVFVRSLATLYNALYYLLIEQNKMPLGQRRVFKCSPPWSDDYRCQASKSKWSEGVFVQIGGTREESAYLAPFYYYCWRGHLPPGPMTVGSEEEKLAYTELLKKYAVAADFPDTKKQIDTMSDQIQELFNLVAELGGAGGQKMQKVQVPETPRFRSGHSPRGFGAGAAEEEEPLMAAATMGSMGPGLRSGNPNMYDQAAANDAQLAALHDRLQGMDENDEAAMAALAHVQQLRAANDSVKQRAFGHITGPPNDLGAKVTGPPSLLDGKQEAFATTRIVGPPSSAPPQSLLMTTFSRPRVLGPPSGARGRVNGPPAFQGSRVVGPPTSAHAVHAPHKVSGPPSARL